MPSTVNELSPVLKEFSIEVPGEDVSLALEKAYAKLSREARVRGFRRGKAPRGVLRRMFGRAVLSEIRGELVARFFVEALAEHKIEPVAEPEFDLGELVEGQGYAFKVKVETTPRLDEVNFDGIEIERYRIEVAPELVEAELKRLQASMATSREPEEARPARVGDLLAIRAKRWEEGEWTSARMPPEQELLLEKGEIPEELLRALDGASVNDEHVVEIEQPGTDGARNRLLVKVLGIKERQLPELDDELAKDLGDFETLDALKEDLEQKLREMLEENENERVRSSLFDKLKENNPLDLPESLVQRQTEAMENQFEGILSSARAEGKDDDGEMARRLREGAANAARSAIHHHVLVKELARLWEIEVTDDQVDEELLLVAKRSELPLPMVRAEYAKGSRVDELKNKILERKVFDLALTKVKIVEVDPPSRGDKKDSEDDGGK